MGRTFEPAVAAGAMSSTAQPTWAIDDELTLRPWTHDDSAAVIEAFTTPDIQYWHARSIERSADAVAWIDRNNTGWAAETGATWAIEIAGGVAGRVTMYTDLAEGLGEIGYWVLSHARGRRVATRACVAATRWAHDLGLHRVTLEHSVANKASGRVAERAGFIREGVLREAALHADGFHDMVLHSHLAGER